MPTLPTPPAKAKQKPEQTFDATLLIPGLFFFYGSLMDPDVLQKVTETSETPELRKGWIEGFQMRMWGIYPTLVPKDGGRVDGMFWRINHISLLHRLQRYETDAYKPCVCKIHSEDGPIVEQGATFCWAGGADDSDLEDGAFDLERYQKYFKPSVFRKK